ncbi:[Pyruvate dehydrogenase (acetyl-transferring)] kinase isozyme 2 [Coemansia biformis]|uniref:Protein-serine/threonine kinase n=1 Tax=Coemansia biformis TaxID=1286918 RepID=A0A9W8CXY0_9FUNG|nr:[Pyruvate dehydrogenase (acetyl-transferring)] kinase isozyme 2 [Coemansia biformis]
MSVKASSDRFRRLASKEMTKLTLSQYYTAGRHLLKNRNGGDAGFSAFRLTANFLHRELSVRIGQTAIGLEQNPTPYHIHRIPQFAALLANYADDLSLLVDRTPEPNTPEANDAFVCTLRQLKTKYRANMWMLSQGLRELAWAIGSRDLQVVPDFLSPTAAAAKSGRPALPRQHYSSTLAYPDLSAPMAYLAPSGNMEMTDPAKWSQPEACVDAHVSDPQHWTPNRVCSEFCNEPACRNPRLWISDGTQRCAENQMRRFFDWLYSMNLGTQLLIEDHVAIHDYGHNLVQIIQPLAIADRAARDARLICERHFGFPAPAIKVIAPKPAITTTYVPHHLYSMLLQLLNNALRATVERHQGRRGGLPAIRLVMSSGDEDVAFKVSDEGGGIPLSQVDAIWSYLRTTTDHADDAASPLSRADRPEKGAAPSSITFMQHASDMPLFGAGDGLPMTRQIARYFGGDLDLVSMEGVGTDAYLHLSRSRNATEPALDLSALLDVNVPATATLAHTGQQMY